MQPQPETKFIVEWVEYSLQHDLFDCNDGEREAAILYEILKGDTVRFLYDRHSMCYIGNSKKSHSVHFDPFYVNWPPNNKIGKVLREHPFKGFECPMEVEGAFSQYMKIDKKYKHFEFTYFDINFMRQRLLPLFEMMNL